MENDDKYLPELLAEKDSLDPSFTHAMKLLNAGEVFFFCLFVCFVFSYLFLMPFSGGEGGRDAAFGLERERTFNI